MDDFDKLLLEKIDSGICLTEREISEVVHGYGIESEYGDNRRWSRSVTTYSKIGERYFSTEWENGLTECQDNDYSYQPVEVKLVKYEKMIMVREWIPVNEDIGGK